MFGEFVEDEISKNLIHITGYPKWVAWAVTFLIAVMPITKAPLNAHPIIVTAESMLGLDQRSIVSTPKSSYFQTYIS
jgi:solute carrier family 32 (vesicular inhibitory amino acid transporter)